uniref:Uncharacterized protein LOC105040908 isoform X2 n=1 Tax=Elaeis guineensis var. tenera TaxID=51953 RepID=A0A6I9R0N2_ELAGV|nr:uncharacterized protein LOC105040908 isoform X2 [Elaeis guineensis]
MWNTPASSSCQLYMSASKEVSWRSRCIATAACVILGSSIAGFSAGDGAVIAAGDDLKVMEVSEGKVVRWSDRRKCPPWHVNSLENIVPENLPRPPTGPRSDGFVAHKNAPKAGAFSIQYRSSCFSL